MQRKQVLLQRAVLAERQADVMQLEDSEERAVEVGGANARAGLLFDWATKPGEQRAIQTERLRFAAQAYRGMYRVSRSERGGLGPSHWSILLGGLLGLFVGGFVFLPIVDLMFMVIRTGGAP